MDKKKLLILTLGTGGLDKEEGPAYRPTQYEIQGERFKIDGMETKTNFVAESLIASFAPDEVFILGTVKSVWHQFYASAISADNNDTSFKNGDYKTLLELEKTHGIETGSEECEKCSEVITKVLNDTSKWKKYYGFLTTEQLEKMRVHAVVTQYGVNEEELMGNYSVLKNTIEEVLDPRYEYEVAFDITHSFRSLPLYNLIILNYIKNITNITISIKHIYYGNIEVRYENNEIAPVIDLAELAQVLDMSNAVSEFKNTGNAVSLLSLLKDEDDELKRNLELFDTATQLNAFSKAKDSLTDLYGICKNTETDTIFTGVREMIRIVLEEKFFGNQISTDLGVVDDVTLKYMLTKWFYNQNRMGLALATGLEALRDINTPMFIEMTLGKSIEEAIAGSRVENNRTGAEVFFIDIARRLRERLNVGNELTKTEQVVCRMGGNLRLYKDIRNRFAHSLSDINSNTIDIQTDIAHIKTFMDDLSYLEDNKASQAYKDLFTKQSSTPGHQSSNSSKCRVIVEFGTRKTAQEICEIFSRSCNSRYDVYRLNQNIGNKLHKKVNKNDYYVDDAFSLMQYLEKHLLSADFECFDKIQIILAECPIDKEAIVVALLNGICRQDERISIFIYDPSGDPKIHPVTRLYLPVDVGSLEEKTEKWDEASMSMPLEKI